MVTRSSEREREYLENLIGWNNKLANLCHAAAQVVYGEKEIENRHDSPDHRALMEGLNWQGVNFRFLEVPGKGHLYDPPPLAPDILAHARPEFPRQIVYYTGCTRFNKAGWVEVDLIETAGRVGGIAAHMDDDNYLRVNTTDLRQFTLTPDRGIDPAKKLRVLVDAQPIWIANPTLPLRATFAKGADGKWALAAERWPAGHPVKRKGLAGPMREITYAGSLIIYGTGAGKHNWVLRHKAELIARQMRGVHYVGNERSGARFIIKSDAEVTEDELRAKNLWLIGNAEENRIVAALQKDLPFAVGPDSIRVGQSEFSGKDYAINFIYPSPMNSERYVYINGALTARAYNHAASNAHLYDYGVNLNDGLDNGPVLLGVFNTDWQFQDDLVIYRKDARP
jgi:hypothetical protein